MSPLARPLLALACAALLHAACAQSYCTPAAKGYDGKVVKFQLLHLNASLGSEICFDTYYNDYDKNTNCLTWYGRYYKLVGESALACDWEYQPGLNISDDLKTICVTRHGNLEPPATLQIMQFCASTSSLTSPRVSGPL